MEETISEGLIRGAKEIVQLKGTKLEKMEKYICIVNGKTIGTGFFTKIFYNNKLTPVLITNFHVVDDEFIENNKQLKFYMNDKRKIISIDKKRKIYSSKKGEYDIMIIKLNEEDDINNYLEIDQNIFEKNSEYLYKDELIYILHFPYHQSASISYGTGIEKINNYDIKHTCNTENGSSGGPIINYFTNKIIGIHKGFIKNKNFNIGTFLKFPLNDLKQQKDFNEININNNIEKKHTDLISNDLERKTYIKSKEYNQNNLSKLFNIKNIDSKERLYKDYKNLQHIPLSKFGISVGLYDEDNILNWKISILGAKDTPYAGGFFYLKILFPENYPESGPKIYFLTPIYHLNVCPKKDNLGYVNINIKKFLEPETTVREILTKLYAVFYLANPDSCYYSLKEVKEYKNNRALYETKVKYFTKKYANPLGKHNIENKDWNFFCNENELKSYIDQNKKEINNNISSISDRNDDNIINMYFSDNGKRRIEIDCRMNDITKDVIQRCLEILGIFKNVDENDMLFIYLCKKLNLNASISENNLHFKSHITMIDNVSFI